ncbi:MAG: hypothetical protein IKO35_04055, partial [Elusimicrobiaceae bacterium]|nr:hypothetical protein [Elusimicrobiaceae bacterium]
PDCGTPASDSDFKVWLNHIKFIQYDATYQYPVPYFYVVDYENGYDSVVNHVPANLGSRLHVNLIMELPTAPIVNDVTEEIFVLPNGFRQPPQPQP